MPLDGRPEDRSARRAPDLAPRHRSGRPEGSLPAAAVRPHRLSGRRQRSRSAARPPPEGLRHRHLRASLSGQEALPQLLDHRPALPARARQVRHEGDRGRHVPPAGRSRARRSCRTACRRPDPTHARRRTPASITTTPSARRKRTRSGATSRSTRSFYDIATFSIIDYVGGLDDLRAGVVRSIGDPDVRLPRRSGAHAARGRARRAPRLHDRAADPRRDPRCIATRSRKSSPPRLLEEYYKILRAGSAEKTFRGLAEVGPAASRSPRSCIAARPSRCGSRSRRSTRYRRRFDVDARHADERDPARQPARAARHLAALGSCRSGWPQVDCRPSRPAADRTAPRRSPGPRLGELPLARRDVERLRQIARPAAAPARPVGASPRAQRALAHRSIFREALTWLEIHGDAPRARRALEGACSPSAAGRRRRRPATSPPSADAAARRRRRRRRRPADAVESLGRSRTSADQTSPMKSG